MSSLTCSQAWLQKGKKMTVGGYQIDEDNILGYGSFAKVYKGKNKKGQDVCVKAINKYDEKDLHMKIAQNEAKILQHLDHQNVCKLKEVIQKEDHYYLITNLYDGPSLGQYLLCKKKIDKDQVQIILTQLLDALEVLHNKKIMHRDLKPDNIILTFVRQKYTKKLQNSNTADSNIFSDNYSSKKSSVVLIDFGFATKLVNGQYTILQQILGTPSYMAPQLLDSNKYTSKADIWSLGVILYQMIYGKPPWTGRSKTQLLQNIRTQKLKFHLNSQYKISQLLKQILIGCLQFNQEKRISWRELFVLNQNLKNGNIFFDCQDQEIEKQCSCSVFSFRIF